MKRHFHTSQHCDFNRVAPLPTSVSREILPALRLLAMASCPCTGCDGCRQWRRDNGIIYAAGDGLGGQSACGWPRCSANKSTCHAECYWCSPAKVASLAANNVLPSAIADAAAAAPAHLAAPAQVAQQAGLSAPPAAPAAPPAEPPAASVDNVGPQGMALLEQRVAVLEKQIHDLRAVALLAANQVLATAQAGLPAAPDAQAAPPAQPSAAPVKNMEEALQ
jgi:hypothetical protein